MKLRCKLLGHKYVETLVANSNMNCKVYCTRCDDVLTTFNRPEIKINSTHNGQVASFYVEHSGGYGGGGGGNIRTDGISAVGQIATSSTQSFVGYSDAVGLGDRISIDSYNAARSSRSSRSILSNNYAKIQDEE